MNKTEIQWTDHTWNPVTGCDAVSVGCKNCYARVMAHRLKGMGKKKYQNEFEVTVHPECLDEIKPGGKRRMIFVNSMSDTFHEKVPDDFLAKMYNKIYDCPQHIFQILTKRPQRMYDWHTKSMYLANAPCPNLWLGVTAEDQQRADERIPILLDIPAAVRFVSLEPLLGPVKFDEWFHGAVTHLQHEDCYPAYNFGIDWVIVGCESGPKRRECKLEWVRDIVRQCQDAQVSVFVKQLQIDGKVSKNMDEWPDDLRVRQHPKEVDDESHN